MLLDPTNTRHMEVYGNRHVLTLKKVKETDFGNYSCMADNSLGRDRGSSEVSGTLINLKPFERAYNNINILCLSKPIPLSYPF